MKVGDLVQSDSFLWLDYGIGIIIGKEFGAFKVYWPKRGVWCLTGEGGVKQIADKKCP